MYRPKAPSIVDFVRPRFLHLNILIIRACAVGDLVLNLPALQALQLSNPDARFVLVGYPERLEIARRFIRVASVHSLETVEPLVRRADKNR